MQVSDDQALLDSMMEDMTEADELYRPTSYWAAYERSVMTELRTFGLHDFRRRDLSTLASAGAIDSWQPGGFSLTRRVRNRLWGYKDRTGRRITWPISLARAVDRAMNAMLPIDLPWNATVEQLVQLAAEHCRLRAERAGAKPPGAYEPSMAGNPDGVFEVDGVSHTMKTLHYYLRYVACCGHVDLESVRVMVELGCGVGRQIEVFRKLYPGMVFFASDIPPQLYVAEQFLGTVFPDSVISYRETRELTSLDQLGELEPGSIVVLSSWQFPLVSDLEIDLFWNAASFQEMEPHVMRNYLSIVRPVTEWVFLQEQFTGKPRLEDGGVTGVVEPVVFEHYVEALEEFELVDMSEAWGPLGPISEQSTYHDTVWRKRSERRPDGDENGEG